MIGLNGAIGWGQMEKLDSNVNKGTYNLTFIMVVFILKLQCNIKKN